MRTYFCFFIFVFSCFSVFSNFSGHQIKGTFGATFDFETHLKKGTGLPVESLFRYGYEYGHQFASGLYLSGELDWTVVYPRQFKAPAQKNWFFSPPISLWWVPITNAQVGWAFMDSKALVTVGLIYYWGLSASFRYLFNQHVFWESSSLLWVDRIFDKEGFYNEGYDNLHLSTGLGFKF